MARSAISNMIRNSKTEFVINLIMIPLAVGWGVLASHVLHLTRPWWFFALFFMAGSVLATIEKLLFWLIRE